VDEVLALLRRKIMQKKIDVVRRYDFSGEIVLYPGEMRQVLSNLVVNAIEAMQPGGKVIVHIYETRKWNDGEVRGVRISIADTGTGIAPEQLQHIGEPFFTTKGQKGTGLGLWVSQGILRKYGGELRISSSTKPEHHGTVFSMFLPKEMKPVAPAKDTARQTLTELAADPKALLG
jgi:signal transduction histidine kinase